MTNPQLYPTSSPASTPTRSAPDAAPVMVRVETYPGSGRVFTTEDFETICVGCQNPVMYSRRAECPCLAPRPTLAPLPPSAYFLATLQTPSRPWLTDLSEADLKSYIRSACQRRDIRMANVYAAELARRNTLCQLEREHGYAALASALVKARKGQVAA